MAYHLRKVVPVAGASQTITFDHDNGSEVILFVSANTSVINLPGATGFGSRILVKKLSASGTTTIQPAGGQSIDGAANYSLANQNRYVELLSIGDAGWAIVGNG